MIAHLKTAAAGLLLGLTVAAAAPAQGGPAGQSYSVLLDQGDMCTFDFQGEGDQTGSIYASCDPGDYVMGRVASWSTEFGLVTFMPATTEVARLGFFALDCDGWTAPEVHETVSEVCWINPDAAVAAERITRTQ